MGRSRSLTQEDEDAGQDGDERAAAEAHREHVGLGAAGQHVALVVTAAHLDGQRARAAEHRLPAVRNQDGPCAWRGGARPGSRVTGGD